MDRAHAFHCDGCGRNLASTAGYGVADGLRYCYQCCAIQDEDRMQEEGTITLYLDSHRDTRWSVQNWPGSLKIPVLYTSVGRHNIAGVQRHVWFWGPDGRYYWGRQYGEFSQLCYCKHIKGVGHYTPSGYPIDRLQEV